MKVLVEQMIELGLFPPNVKTILAQKIVSLNYSHIITIEWYLLQTTVDKIIEVTKPVLSYLKFQLSDRMQYSFDMNYLFEIYYYRAISTNVEGRSENELKS